MAGDKYLIELDNLKEKVKKEGRAKWTKGMKAYMEMREGSTSEEYARLGR